MGTRTAISLFSGCGGSDKGLEYAGFDILMSNDKDSYACDTYKENFPNTENIHGTVESILSFPKADLLVGCYPCQGFSQGGVRKPNRTINYLYREFDRALRNIKPKVFVVENVSGMTRSNNQQLLKNQVYRFRLAGYCVTQPQILNASEYGVAQDRNRVFIVGIRSDIGVSYSFPDPTHGPGRQNPMISQKDVLAGLPRVKKREVYDSEFHWYYMSRNRRREWDEPSATIVSNPRHMPLHPSSPMLKKHGDNDWRFVNKKRARRFSYKEAAILQGFPKSFIFPDHGSLAQKYRVIGNAVPPPLFQAVVEAIPDIW